MLPISNRLISEQFFMYKLELNGVLCHFQQYSCYIKAIAYIVHADRMEIIVGKGERPGYQH